MSNKNILFISALDFKEKSIQVIRKTPEAYREAGFRVDYLVARDDVPNGNYSYERLIDPPGIRVYRIYWPLGYLRSRLGRFSSLIIGKFTSLYVVLRLGLAAILLLKKNRYDVVYGYELHGVLALNLIRFFLPRGTTTVARFQGTFLNEMLVQKQFLRICFNLDLILAIRADSDLLIMTDDGTQGDLAVKKIKGKKPFRMVFWTNGVDYLPQKTPRPFEHDDKEVFVSISRLVKWKRIDRNLSIMKQLLELDYTNFVYYIIGDGADRKRLESLCEKLGLSNHVVFVGSLEHSSAIAFLVNSDVFFSMYSSSNVGNPLLEAIRANKIIVTLANGSTGEWIRHRTSGLIYDEKDLNYGEVAQDIVDLISDELDQEKMKKCLRDVEKQKLLTWKKRLHKEVTLVRDL